MSPDAGGKTEVDKVAEKEEDDGVEVPPPDVHEPSPGGHDDQVPISPAFIYASNMHCFYVLTV